jgi:hypothetical protein
VRNVSTFDIYELPKHLKPVTDPNAQLVSSFRDQALLSADASHIQFTPLKVAAVPREEVVSLPDGTTYTLRTVIIGEPRPLSLRSIQTQCDSLL